MKGQARNLISLIAIQGSNAALPLLVFPYALSVLGAAHYADLVFTEALSIIAIAIVLYSFEIDGVAEVAGLIPESQANRISCVLSKVLYARLCLFLTAAPLLVAGIAWYRPELWELACWWMLVPLSYALQPAWVFLGLQRNIAPAICTLASRAGAVMLILLLVRESRDALLLPQIIGLSYVCGSLFMLLWAYLGLGLRLTRLSLAEVYVSVKSGKEIFLGNIGVVVYRDSNVLLLGLIGLAGAELAAYSLAEKVTKAVQAAIRPLNQLFFPRAVLAARAVGRANRQTWVALGRLTSPQLIALVSLWIILLGAYQLSEIYFLLSDKIPEIERFIFLVLIMSLSTLFGVCNFMFGSTGLNVLGERRHMLHSILAAATISTGSTLILGSLFGATGAAASLVLAEGALYALILWRYVMVPERSSAWKRK